MQRVSERESVVEMTVAEFLKTMPERYREQFGWAAICEHARIARERGQRPAHGGMFGASHQAGPALCVVAPDRAGLLAAISASLTLEGFNIRQADAYTRKPLEGDYEAVALFWVRRERLEKQASLTNQDVMAVCSTLVELLSNGSMLPPPRGARAAMTPGTAQTSVRFVERPTEAWLTLELQTNDRTGLLLAVAEALFGEGVQIIGSRIRTVGLRVYDRFDLVEANGSRIAGTRLKRIQLAVLAAVDGPNDLLVPVAPTAAASH